MRNVFLPFLIVIFGAVFYQISQKSVPKEANPLLVLILAYSFGIALCLLFSLFFPFPKTISESMKDLNWTVLGIGLGAVMIEIGYLLAYKTGANISLTSLITSIAISILLIPVGIFIYKESISVWNAAGIVLCIVGLCLIFKR